MEKILGYILVLICLFVFYFVFFYVIKPAIYVGVEIICRKIFKIPLNKPVSKWILYLIIMSIILPLGYFLSTIFNL